MQLQQQNFIICKVHYARHTSLIYIWVKLYKRREVNCKPGNFLTFMNNGIAFPNLGKDFQVALRVRRNSPQQGNGKFW